MPWVKARDVSFLGSDAAADVVPSQVDEVRLPGHMLTIVAMGVDLFDNQELEALADTAAELNRWEFMLVAGPLAVQNGTGSPINALTIFYRTQLCRPSAPRLAPGLRQSRHRTNRTVVCEAEDSIAWEPCRRARHSGRS